jgi:hypothetical protein
MNTVKRVCKCGVEWVKDECDEDDPNCQIIQVETCDCCCPEIDKED